MTRFLMTTSVAALLGVAPVAPVAADAGFMLGGTVAFGGGQPAQFGISARVISDTSADQGVLGAGATFYPGTGEIGFDVFAGYTFDAGVFGVGYDFARRQPLVSLGHADMADESPTPPPPPPPPPP